MLRFFNKRLHNRKGFTLIELIVVIAILGILALIAIPRFAGMQDRAKVKTDISNAAIIGNAAEVALVEGKITTSTASADIQTALVGTNNYLTSWPTPKYKAGTFVVSFNGTAVNVSYTPASGTAVVLYPAPSPIPDTY